MLDDAPEDSEALGASLEPEGVEAELVLSASFVDTAGNPVAGVEASLPKLELILGASDAAGRLELEVSVPGLLPEDIRHDFRRMTIEFWAPGFAAERRRVEWRTPVSYAVCGEVVLEPGALVAGRVLTERGDPVEGARVRWARSSLEAEAARDGRFAFRGIPLIEGTFSAWASGDRWVRSDRVTLIRGSNPDIELRVPALHAGVAGIVYAPSGEPVAGATVEIHSSGGPTDWPYGEQLMVLGYVGHTEDSETETETDAMGRFAFEALSDEGPFSILATPAKPFAYPALVHGVVAGEPSVELTLASPEWLELAVVSDDQEPIPWSHVDVRGRDTWLKLGVGPTGDDGVLRVLRPTREFEVQALAPGYRTQTFGPFQPGEVGERLSLTLQPGGAVAGRVVFDGAPVSNAEIVLSATTPADTVRWSTEITELEEPFAVETHARLEPRCATTDARGRFLASIHSDRRHVLVVRAEGLPLTPFDLGQLSVASGRLERDFEIPSPGSLEGEVFPPPGQPREGIRVGVSAGWGIVETAFTDAAGRYRFDDLAPGSWQVRACPLASSNRVVLRRAFEGDGDIHWDCEVVAGRTARFDLDLRERGEYRLQGCLQLAAKPVVGRDVRIFAAGWKSGPQAKTGLAWTQTGDEGCFELRLSRGGMRTVEARFGRWIVSQELALNRGSTDWSPRLDTGTLVITGNAPRNEKGQVPRAHLRATTGAGLQCLVRVGLSALDSRSRKPLGMLFGKKTSDSNKNEIRIVEAPVGEVELIIQADSGGDAEGWLSIAQVTLLPGGEVTLDLP